jgi:type IV pilus assembly protein PilE
MEQETSMMTKLQRMKDEQGITLVELLAVVAIVAILAAISIPLYTGYMQRARRADAKTALEQLRASQEMRRAEKGGYSTSLTQLQNTFSGPGATAGDYSITLSSASATTFLGRAHPTTSRQASDGDLTINQNGTKLPVDKWAK